MGDSEVISRRYEYHAEKYLYIVFLIHWFTYCVSIERTCDITYYTIHPIFTNICYWVMYVFEWNIFMDVIQNSWYINKDVFVQWYSLICMIKKTLQTESYDENMSAYIVIMKIDLHLCKYKECDD